MSGTNGHGPNGNGKVTPVLTPPADVLPAVVDSNQAAPAPTEATSPVPSVYAPTPRALALLRAYLTLAGQGARVTIAQLAAAMIPPMTEDALRKWRTRNPDADSWVMAELQRQTETEWPLILRRASELAIKGSIDHMRFFADVTGRAPRAVAGANLGGAAINTGDHARIQVIIHGLPLPE